jgi:hypothetical protein
MRRFAPFVITTRKGGSWVARRRVTVQARVLRFAGGYGAVELATTPDPSCPAVLPVTVASLASADVAADLHSGSLVDVHVDRHGVTRRWVAQRVRPHGAPLPATSLLDLPPSVSSSKGGKLSVAVQAAVVSEDRADQPSASTSSGDAQTHPVPASMQAVQAHRNVTPYHRDHRRVVHIPAGGRIAVVVGVKEPDNAKGEVVQLPRSSNAQCVIRGSIVRVAGRRIHEVITAGKQARVPAAAVGLAGAVSQFDHESRRGRVRCFHSSQDFPFETSEDGIAKFGRPLMSDDAGTFVVFDVVAVRARTGAVLATRDRVDQDGFQLRARRLRFGTPASPSPLLAGPESMPTHARGGVVASRCAGEVVAWNGRYGFLRTPEYSKDVFLATADAGTTTVAIGMTAVFDVVHDAHRAPLNKHGVNRPEQSYFPVKAANVRWDLSARTHLAAAEKLTGKEEGIASAQSAIVATTSDAQVPTGGGGSLAVRVATDVTGVVSHRMTDHVSAVRVQDPDAPEAARRYVACPGKLPIGSIVTLNVTSVWDHTTATLKLVGSDVRVRADVTQAIEAAIVAAGCTGVVRATPLTELAALDLDEPLADLGTGMSAETLMLHARRAATHLGESDSEHAALLRPCALVQGLRFKFDVRSDALHDAVHAVDAQCTDEIVEEDVAATVVAEGFVRLAGAGGAPRDVHELIPLVTTEPLLQVPGVRCRVHLLRRNDTFIASHGRPELLRGGGVATEEEDVGEDQVVIPAAPRGIHRDVSRLRIDVRGCLVSYNKPLQMGYFATDTGHLVFADRTALTSVTRVTNTMEKPWLDLADDPIAWLSRPVLLDEAVSVTNQAMRVRAGHVRRLPWTGAMPWIVHHLTASISRDNTVRWPVLERHDVKVPVVNAALARKGKTTYDIVRHPITGSLHAFAGKDREGL